MLRVAVISALLANAVGKTVAGRRLSDSSSESDMIQDTNVCGENPWDNCYCNCDFASELTGTTGCDCTRPFDDDGDGRLTRENMAAAEERCWLHEEHDMAAALGNSEGYAAESPAISDIHFRALDHNGDGFISNDEWCEGMSSHDFFCWKTRELHAIWGDEQCLASALGDNMAGWKEFIRIMERMTDQEVQGLDDGIVNTEEYGDADAPYYYWYVRADISDWAGYITFLFNGGNVTVDRDHGVVEQVFVNGWDTNGNGCVTDADLDLLIGLDPDMDCSVIGGGAAGSGSESGSASGSASGSESEPNGVTGRRTLSLRKLANMGGKVDASPIRNAMCKL